MIYIFRMNWYCNIWENGHRIFQMDGENASENLKDFHLSFNKNTILFCNPCKHHILMTEIFGFFSVPPSFSSFLFLSFPSLYLFFHVQLYPENLCKLNRMKIIQTPLYKWFNKSKSPTFFCAMELLLCPKTIILWLFNKLWLNCLYFYWGSYWYWRIMMLLKEFILCQPPWNITRSSPFNFDVICW